MFRNLNHSRGFSLPIAIFIITVMALIGTAMVSITQTGQESVASEIQSIRAFYSAESGAQLAMHQLFPLNGGASSCANVTAVSPKTLSAGGFTGCIVTLGCDDSVHPSNSYFVITSTANCSFAGTVTSRTITVMAKSP